MDLFDAAARARDNAYAPYSNFRVGAAIRAADGTIFAGCNVENVAYPQGTCAEAGAIAAMVARRPHRHRRGAGDRRRPGGHRPLRRLPPEARRVRRAGDAR